MFKYLNFFRSYATRITQSLSGLSMWSSPISYEFCFFPSRRKRGYVTDPTQNVCILLIANSISSVKNLKLIKLHNSLFAGFNFLTSQFSSLLKQYRCYWLELPMVFALRCTRNQRRKTLREHFRVIIGTDHISYVTV